jgi:hypothetical protein
LKNGEQNELLKWMKRERNESGNVTCCDPLGK